MKRKLWLGVFAVLSTLSFATAAGTLAEAHTAKKLECSVCHTDKAAPTKADESACIGCHGNLEKMADSSEGKFAVNPHAPHGAKLTCLRCHKGHQPFENYCNKCHEFNFKRK